MPSTSRHVKAVESALGLEPIGHETRAEAELRRRWERHFAPLGLALPPETPPGDMFYRIQGTLDRNQDRRIIEKLKRSRAAWRIYGVLATVALLGLGAFVLSERGVFSAALEEAGDAVPTVQTDVEE